MNCIILGGFLGAGKTSVLLQLARQITQHCHGDSLPLVILENEIGEVSVDSRLLGEYPVKELFSGCVCCTLAGSLTETVKSICKDYAPEYILIETSGMAHPEKAADTIRRYAPEAGEVRIMAVADAERFDELMDYMDVFISRQLSLADWIVINKTDTVDSSALSRIIAAVRGINSHAFILPFCAREPDEHTLWDLIGGHYDET